MRRLAVERSHSRRKSFVEPVWSFLQTHPIGQVFSAPYDVVFSRFDVVEPDLLYLSNQTASRVITEQNVQGAPDLVVEIASPRTRKRDATVKLRLYERWGVPEYWLVDPGKNAVMIYRNDEGRFRPATALSRMAGDVLVTALVPGFELPLARLLRG